MDYTYLNLILSYTEIKHPGKAPHFRINPANQSLTGCLKHPKQTNCKDKPEGLEPKRFEVAEDVNTNDLTKAKY